MTKAEMISKKFHQQPPAERIYGWMDSQLSVARFYGGMTMHGHRYMIDYDAEGHPLVRADVLEADAKAKKLALKAKRASEKQAAIDAQGVML